MSQELIGAIGGGCLGTILAIVGFCAAIPGAVLLYGAVSELAFHR
jgi:hypothetical protein